jgi:hypothetical protein
VFGELGGFITALGNKRLTGNKNVADNLDFSDYDHIYDVTNIKASWDSVAGSGYFYPLIDYGNVSTDKVNFQVKSFRPALYVAEYIKKIFEKTDYTYTLDLLPEDQNFFNRLIIPQNQKSLTKITSNFPVATKTTEQIITGSSLYRFTTVTGSGLVATSSNSVFTYTGAASITLSMIYSFSGDATSGVFNILKKD